MYTVATSYIAQVHWFNSHYVCPGSEVDWSEEYSWLSTTVASATSTQTCQAWQYTSIKIWEGYNDWGGGVPLRAQKEDLGKSSPSGVWGQPLLGFPYF